MLWSSIIWSTYDPSYCYGHDEPTASYISTAPGSGEDARFRFTLPSDTASVAQGSLYATIWFGGTVYDTQSTAGGNQGFLEFQFYPAPPAATGPNSGSTDCASHGGFNYVFSPGSNDWFACAIVWQLQPGSENAAIATPLDVAGSAGAILEMHSGDEIYLNYSGVAKSTTQGWTLSVSDTTQGLSGSVTLVNGGLVLSPYYSTAAPGNTLLWGASNPGAIAFAYEIGHALNQSIPQNNGYGACYPGDHVCASYWPGNWSRSGQIDLELPTVGSAGSVTYPSQVVFSSSQGGEAEVNSTTYSNCGGAPSTSPTTNCMYPYFQYRSGSYGFTFGTSTEPNATHTYGGEYQFPATQNPSTGQWNGRSVAAPWGTLNTTVSPLNASVEFNRIGSIDRLVVASNGSAGGQFEEGPYWLNVSAPGCTGLSERVYLGTGAFDRIAAQLSCGTATALSATASATPTSGTGPLPGAFTGGESGGVGPYSYRWSFGDGGTSSGQDVSHTYAAAGVYTATVLVTDAHGDTAGASVTITVTAPLGASASANRTAGPAPLSVQFAGRASGGSPPYAYLWTFGDGTVASLQDPAHTYLSAGTYTATFTVTDSNAVQASSSLSITVAAPVLYTTWFNESGLPAGTPWAVSAGGSTLTTHGSSLAFRLANGVYSYTVNVTNSSYRPVGAHGSVTVAGQNQTVAVPFVPVDYFLTFYETTLPVGSAWAVRIGGSTGTATGSSVTFNLTNGTYAFAANPPPGFAASPSSGTVSIAGAPVNQSVVFSPVYRVDFAESGLLSGARWTVRFNGTLQASTGGWDNFSAPNGRYLYSVAGPAGYTPAPSGGNLTVSLQNQTVPIDFAPTTYAVTIRETGLPNGASWTVTVAGGPHRSTGQTLVLALANGSYPYSVAGPAGYSATNGSGTIPVAGHRVALSIGFSPSPAPTGAGGLFGSGTFLLALAAVALLAAGTVIYAGGARRRRR